MTRHAVQVGEIKTYVSKIGKEDHVGREQYRIAQATAAFSFAQSEELELADKEKLFLAISTTFKDEAKQWEAICKVPLASNVHWAGGLKGSELWCMLVGNKREPFHLEKAQSVDEFIVLEKLVTEALQALKNTDQPTIKTLFFILFATLRSGLSEGKIRIAIDCWLSSYQRLGKKLGLGEKDFFAEIAEAIGEHVKSENFNKAKTGEKPQAVEKKAEKSGIQGFLKQQALEKAYRDSFGEIKKFTDHSLETTAKSEKNNSLMVLKAITPVVQQELKQIEEKLTGLKKPAADAKGDSLPTSISFVGSMDTTTGRINAGLLELKGLTEKFDAAAELERNFQKEWARIENLLIKANKIEFPELKLAITKELESLKEKLTADAAEISTEFTLVKIKNLTERLQSSKAAIDSLESSVGQVDELEKNNQELFRKSSSVVQGSTIALGEKNIVLLSNKARIRQLAKIQEKANTIYAVLHTKQIPASTHSVADRIVQIKEVYQSYGLVLTQAELDLQRIEQADKVHLSFFEQLQKGARQTFQGISQFFSQIFSKKPSQPAVSVRGGTVVHRSVPLAAIKESTVEGLKAESHYKGMAEKIEEMGRTGLAQIFPRRIESSASVQTSTVLSVKNEQKPAPWMNIIRDRIFREQGDFLKCIRDQKDEKCKLLKKVIEKPNLTEKTELEKFKVYTYYLIKSIIEEMQDAAKETLNRGNLYRKNGKIMLQSFREELIVKIEKVKFIKNNLQHILKIVNENYPVKKQSDNFKNLMNLFAKRIDSFDKNTYGLVERLEADLMVLGSDCGKAANALGELNSLDPQRAAAALEQVAHEEKFNLVLVEITSHDEIQKIRENKEFRHLPILVKQGAHFYIHGLSERGGWRNINIETRISPELTFTKDPELLPTDKIPTALLDEIRRKKAHCGYHGFLAKELEPVLGVSPVAQAVLPEIKPSQPIQKVERDDDYYYAKLSTPPAASDIKDAYDETDYALKCLFSKLYPDQESIRSDDLPDELRPIIVRTRLDSDSPEKYFVSPRLVFHEEGSGKTDIWLLIQETALAKFKARMTKSDSTVFLKSLDADTLEWIALRVSQSPQNAETKREQKIRKDLTRLCREMDNETMLQSRAQLANAVSVVIQKFIQEKMLTSKEGLEVEINNVDIFCRRVFQFKKVKDKDGQISGLHYWIKPGANLRKWIVEDVLSRWPDDGTPDMKKFAEILKTELGKFNLLDKQGKLLSTSTPTRELDVIAEEMRGKLWQCEFETYLKKTKVLEALNFIFGKASTEIKSIFDKNGLSSTEIDPKNGKMLKMGLTDLIKEVNRKLEFVCKKSEDRGVRSFLANKIKEFAGSNGDFTENLSFGGGSFPGFNFKKAEDQAADLEETKVETLVAFSKGLGVFRTYTGRPKAPVVESTLSEDDAFSLLSDQPSKKNNYQVHEKAFQDIIKILYPSLRSVNPADYDHSTYDLIKRYFSGERFVINPKAFLGVKMVTAEDLKKIGKEVASDEFKNIQKVWQLECEQDYTDFANADFAIMSLLKKLAVDEPGKLEKLEDNTIRFLLQTILKNKDSYSREEEKFRDDSDRLFKMQALRQKNLAGGELLILIVNVINMVASRAEPEPWVEKVGWKNKSEHARRIEIMQEFKEILILDEESSSIKLLPNLNPHQLVKWMEDNALKWSELKEPSIKQGFGDELRKIIGENRREKILAKLSPAAQQELAGEDPVQVKEKLKNNVIQLLKLSEQRERMTLGIVELFFSCGLTEDQRRIWEAALRFAGITPKHIAERLPLEGATRTIAFLNKALANLCDPKFQYKGKIEEIIKTIIKPKLGMGEFANLEITGEPPQLKLKAMAPVKELKLAEPASLDDFIPLPATAEALEEEAISLHLARVDGEYKQVKQLERDALELRDHTLRLKDLVESQDEGKSYNVIWMPAPEVKVSEESQDIAVLAERASIVNDIRYPVIITKGKETYIYGNPTFSAWNGEDLQLVSLDNEKKISTEEMKGLEAVRVPILARNAKGEVYLLKFNGQSWQAVHEIKRADDLPFPEKAYTTHSCSPCQFALYKEIDGIQGGQNWRLTKIEGGVALPASSPGDVIESYMIDPKVFEKIRACKGHHPRTIASMAQRILNVQRSTRETEGNLTTAEKLSKFHDKVNQFMVKKGAGYLLGKVSGTLGMATETLIGVLPEGAVPSITTLIP